MILVSLTNHLTSKHSHKILIILSINLVYFLYILWPFNFGGGTRNRTINLAVAEFSRLFEHLARIPPKLGGSKSIISYTRALSLASPVSL